MSTRQPFDWRANNMTAADLQRLYSPKGDRPMSTNVKPLLPDSLFHDGQEQPLQVEWPKDDWEETLRVWHYEKFFSLGGEEMGYGEEDGEETTWVGDITVNVYAAQDYDLTDPAHVAAPTAYLVELKTVSFGRDVYCPTLTDVFTFTNLLAPTLRLNYETRPLQYRGEARQRDAVRRYAALHGEPGARRVAQDHP